MVFGMRDLRGFLGDFWGDLRRKIIWDLGSEDPP